MFNDHISARLSAGLGSITTLLRKGQADKEKAIRRLKHTSGSKILKTYLG